MGGCYKSLPSRKGVSQNDLIAQQNKLKGSFQIAHLPFGEVGTLLSLVSTLPG
jgi:hypothetical protein